jgi:hypothetical protein
LKEGHKEIKKEDVFFEVKISPAFDEPATLRISKKDGQIGVQGFLLGAYGNDRLADTFYFIESKMNDSYFKKFDSSVLQKSLLNNFDLESVVRDGMRMTFRYAIDGDTTIREFRNPQNSIDTAAVKIALDVVDGFKSVLQDSILHQYLEEISLQLRNSPSQARKNRELDILRESKYSH